MGALTNKTAAYQARPWEYDDTFSVDLYDCFGSNIIINTRGTSILRIIPRITITLNTYIITDKVRFSFDSLLIHRILQPAISNYIATTKKKITTNITVPEMLNVVSLVFSATLELYILFGNFIKASLIPQIYNIITELFPTKAYYFTTATDVPTKIGLWSNFLYPAILTTLTPYTLCFCINSNLRLESPVLYYKLQQEIYKRNTFNILFFGSNVGIDFAHQYIKNTFKYLKNVHAGNAKILKTIKQQTILIILGTQSFKQIEHLTEYFIILQQSGILFNIIGVWKNPVNITQSLIAVTSPIVLMYYYMNQHTQEAWRVIISINETCNFLVKAKQINLFIGTHAPKNITEYHIILPLFHHYETAGGYFNFQGVYQITNKAIDNPHLFYEFTHMLTPLKKYLNIKLLKK